MTVLEAKNKLFEWFSMHDSFCWKDFNKLVVISAEPEENRAALQAALDVYEKNNFVVKQVVSAKTVEQEFWVLIKPFSSFEQNVVFSADAIKLMSDFLAVVSKVSDNTIDLVDPLSLQQKDVMNIFKIATMYVESVVKEAKKEKN